MNQLEILLKLKNETQAGFAQLEKSVDAVKKQTESLAGAQNNSAAAGLKFGASIGVGFAAVQQFLPAIGQVVGAINDSVRAYAAAGSQLVDLKAKLGVGVVEMQKMQFAAKQSGVDVGSLTTSLAMMERTAAKSPEKFAQLGISFGQIRSSKPDELMRLIADGLEGVSDQNERARISTEIFGRSGSEMLKMLSGNYRELLKDAEATGIMTDEMAAKADRLDDAMTKLDDVTKNLRVNLAAAFASPGMINLMEKMADLIGLMARNADKLYTALKMVSGNGGLFMSLIDGSFDGPGSKQPDFSGVKGGASSTEQDRVKARAEMVKRWADEDRARGQAHERERERHYADIEASAAATQRFVAKAAEALAKVRDAWGDLWEAEQAGTVGLAAMMAQDTTGSMMAKSPAGADPFAWMGIDRMGVPYDQGNSGYVPPRSGLYTDQTATNAEKATKATFDFAQSLQNIANVAALSGSKLGQAVAMIAGGGAGIASGIKDLKGGGFSDGLTGFLGKVGVIGGIASSAISIFGSLFGGGKEKKEAAERARLEALEAEVRRTQEERDRRIAGLSSAAGGLNAFAKGGAITDQASADRAGLYAGAIFGGQVKESGDVVGALKNIGPALADMAAKAKEFGLNLGAGVSNLIGMSNVLEGDSGLSDQLSGLNQMMKGLGDAGMVTRDIFSAFGADASAVFQRLIEGGATGNQALTLMQPTLQQLYEGQKRHGFAVDETTQGLIDQAKAEGIVGDAFMSANERIVELLGILIETVGGTLPDAFKRAADAAESSAGRMAGALGGINVGGLVQDGGSDAGPGFANGTAFRNFGTGTRVTLHGEEAVLRRDQVDRLVSMAVAGAPGSSVPQGGQQQGQPIIVYVMADSEVLGTAVANTIQRGGPAGVAIQTALAGRSIG